MIGKLLESLGSVGSSGALKSLGGGDVSFGSILTSIAKPVLNNFVKGTSNYGNTGFNTGINGYPGYGMQEPMINQKQRNNFSSLFAPGSGINSGGNGNPAQQQFSNAQLQNGGILATLAGGLGGLGALGGLGGFGGGVSSPLPGMTSGLNGGVSTGGLPGIGGSGGGGIPFGNGTNIPGAGFSFPQTGAQGGIIPKVLGPVIGLFTMVKSLLSIKKLMNTVSLRPLETNHINTHYDQSQAYLSNYQPGQMGGPESELQTVGFGNNSVIDENSKGWF